MSFNWNRAYKRANLHWKATHTMFYCTTQERDVCFQHCFQCKYNQPDNICKLMESKAIEFERIVDSKLNMEEAL